MEVSIVEININRSAEKRARQSEARRIRNRSAKSKIKGASRKFYEAVSEKNSEAAQEQLKEVISLLDKYAVKGILHKNTAARRKSRLYAQFNSMQ
ncbi:MAG: 30S ribosomal protein S20 [Spirochaetales bacterium]|nr:30S ribosomal protein S20 [Spirochaetales bacterium]